jgi:hypothetical protein
MEKNTRPVATLCIAPAVLSINAGSHFSFTDTAVKLDSVNPAANGCCYDLIYS